MAWGRRPFRLPSKGFSSLGSVFWIRIPVLRSGVTFNLALLHAHPLSSVLCPSAVSGGSKVIAKMVSFWSTSTGLVIIGSKVYGGYTQPTDPLKSKRTGKSASNLKGKKYDSCVFEAIQPKLLCEWYPCHVRRFEFFTETTAL
ncbi:unnamed protein product [Fusarium graminearum]|uniref:Uncharacterized protein n=1 Tax=Gibberella zeae TaxID=5518 RepID=A0A4E9EJC1_GIBZA|nr:unnamed protein product [Fusarium graminearum]CAG1968888.1 unnamed protein product [Fusarium graminearum]CAG1975495.1 unnamed protein product [Fusarium graminearum]CAG2002655.1 unnamed protein product [Fusarium graminearum]CAG2003923.1 unnamed protein product [Fusarium graminearum]